MKKSDSIKVVVIVVALAVAGVAIAWNLGLFEGGSGKGTVSGGDVTPTSDTNVADDGSGDQVGEGGRKVVSDGFTPKNKF